MRNYKFIEIGNATGNQLTAYGYNGVITNETGLMYIQPKSLNTGTTPSNGIMTMNGVEFDYSTNTLISCGGVQVFVKINLSEISFIPEKQNQSVTIKGKIIALVLDRIRSWGYVEKCHNSINIHT